MPMWPSSKVWPSAAARATKAEPTLPPAPGRLSTITGRPNAGEIFSPTERAKMSVRPPGVNGTTIVIFADGQPVCAHAQRGTSEAATVAEAKPRTWRRRTCPLLFLAPIGAFGRCSGQVGGDVILAHVPGEVAASSPTYANAGMRVPLPLRLHRAKQDFRTSRT